MIHRILGLAATALLAATGVSAQAAPCPITTIGPATALPAATVGVSYLQAVTAANSNASAFQFAVTSGLPPASGLSLFKSGPSSANFSGAPTQAGNFLVTLSATDGFGCTGGRTYALAIGQGTQTIAFTSTPPAGATVGGATYSVGATATSGLPVSFAIAPASSAICAITGSTVSFQATGTCTINANQAGDANWAAAPQAQQSVSVGLASQSISFTSTAPAAAVVAGTPYSVAATATSGLPVALTIDASASAVCAIAGASVTFQSAGTCVVNANQAGNATYSAAPQVQQSFAVSRVEQTIAFTSTAPAAAVVAGTPYSVAATATSGLPVALTIDASASAVCAIAGASVTFQSAGTCVVNANQAGNATYSAAPQVQQSFAVSRVEQTITFTSTAPVNAVFNGAPYSVAATASSGLSVVLTIDASAGSVCAIAGSSVTFQGIGTCVVNANQVGDTTYNAAPQVQQSFTVGQASQTISFASAAPAAAVVAGAPYSVSATATSGLAVTLTVDASASAVCTIAGASVTFQGVGICVINANQAGTTNYAAAPQVQQSFAVGKGSQTIAFTSAAPVGAAVAGPSYTVTATATSGLPVTLSINAGSSGICTIAGASVTFQGAGTCVVDANQPGDANWNAAPVAQQSFTVNRGLQSISYTSAAPAGAVVAGATYTVTATATSGLPVSFQIDPVSSSICTIAGATVSFIGAGTCVVNANQAGDANWFPASQAQQNVAVGKGAQTLGFTSTAPAGAYGGGPTYTVAATSSAGLPVAYTIDASASAICTIAGNVVTFTAAGNCVVNANQPGDANWNAAPQVQQTVAVSACVLLDVGQVLQPALPGGSTVCVASPAGTAAEFTYVTSNYGTTTDQTVALVGSNIQGVTGPPTPRPGETAGLTLAPLADAASADPHGIEVPPAFAEGHVIAATDLIPRPNGVAPLTVGQLIDLNASIGACGATPSIRKGRVEAITTPQSAGQTVLYFVQEVTELSPGVWTPAVAGGAFTASDFQNIGDAFVQSPPGSTPGASFSGTTTLLRSGAMDIETANLGAITDIDGNGGVIVFYTRALNELSPPASSQYLPGTFQQRDLFAAASCGGSNEGEILYMSVPDATGAVNSNVRTQSLVYGAAGPTLTHHYQHLVNAWRRVYVNSASAFEALWLDEALSWSMQELVFYNVAGLAPRTNIQLSTLTTGPSASVRVAAFNTYQNPIYQAMRSFFYQLGSSNGSRRLGPLRQTPFTVSAGAVSHDIIAQNFAHTHTFLRYALDRKNTGDTALFQALVNTTQSGLPNLQTALGVDVGQWSRDFLVATYTDDAVGGVDPSFTTPSWNYRSVYGGLGGFQLTVDVLSNNTPLSFAIGSGGGARYSRFGVPEGQTATLTLTQGGSPAAAPINVAIVRTK